MYSPTSLLAILDSDAFLAKLEEFEQVDISAKLGLIEFTQAGTIQHELYRDLLAAELSKRAEQRGWTNNPTSPDIF